MPNAICGLKAGLAVLGLLFLSACDSVSNEIRGRDKGVLLPTGRLFIPVTEDRLSEEGETEDARRRRGIFGLELAGDFASGDFAQSGTGIATDYDMWQASLAARTGIAIEDRIRLEAIVGAGWHDIGLDAAGPLVPVSRDESGIGLLVGAQVTWEPLDRLGIYGRATTLGIPIDATSSMAEFGLSVRAYEELRLLLGYRYWRYRFEGEASLADGDIDLKVQGLLLGVELRF